MLFKIEHFPTPKNGDMGLKRFMEKNKYCLPSFSDDSKEIDSRASIDDSTIF